MGGIAIGLVIGFLFLKAQKFLPTDVNMDIILTLVTPYFMYICAEEVYASGILAVVSGGLYLSSHRHQFLSSSSRLRGENVWQTFVFLLNGLVFLFIGLDLPEITHGLKKDGVSFYEATGYGLLIALVLIFGRMIAAFGALVVTRIAARFIAVADNNPGIQGPFVLGWAGMRGVVSLAAALSIPVTLDNDVAFPHRNLILYITFVVILVTLVLQGLTLPMLIKRVNLRGYEDHLSEEETEKLIHNQLAAVSLNYLTKNHAHELAESFYLQKLHKHWQNQLQTDEPTGMPGDITIIYKKVFNKQRELLLDKNLDEQIDEEIIRKFLHLIDLEEEKINSD